MQTVNGRFKSRALGLVRPAFRANEYSKHL